MKSFIALAVIALAVYGSCGPVQHREITDWEEFKIAFGKKYSTPEEEALRKANFEKSLKYVQDNQGKHFGVTLGINELSDLSDHEFLAMNSATPFNQTENIVEAEIAEYEQLPTHFDWRDHVQFNAIEQQGVCGSCWSFATTATVEILYAYRHKKHLYLSKSQLVECASKNYDPSYQNQGCNYGYPPEAYRYIEQHGLYEERFYPYRGVSNERCYERSLGSSHPKYHINAYYRLANNAPDASIMSIIRNHGPGAVVIHGTTDVFKHYRGGIIRNLLPHSNQVNHVVALIGWGSENGVDFWIIRNSWGTGWGEHGYARIERHHNLIGLNNWFSYPILN